MATQCSTPGHSGSQPLLAGCGGVGTHPCSLHGHQAPTAHSAGVPPAVLICLQVAFLPTRHLDLSWKPWEPPRLPGMSGCRPSPAPCHASEKKEANVASDLLLVWGGFLGMYVCECYDRQAGMNLSHCLDTALHPISLLYRRKQIRRPRVIPAGSPSSELRAGPRSYSHLCPFHFPDHLPQVFIWLIVPILLPRICPVLF